MSKSPFTLIHLDFIKSVSLFKAQLTNQNGQETSRNFLFSEHLPDGYTLKHFEGAPQYLDKQAYCCVLMDDQDDFPHMQLNGDAQKLVSAKLGSLAHQKACIVKVTYNSQGFKNKRCFAIEFHCGSYR